MPSTSRSNLANNKSKQEITPEHTNFENTVAELNEGPRANRKKSKNAVEKQSVAIHGTDKTSEAEIKRNESTLPVRSQSILGQLPASFPQPKRSSDLDVLEELNTSEKVSDEHTPPQDTWLPTAQSRPSPQADLLSSLNPNGSPPVQYGHIERGGFSTTRSPPISPPQVKARPVSYGGPVALPLGYPKASTSPYGYLGPAFGSPQALPHLPQQHFHHAYDVDLGVGVSPLTQKQAQTNFIKFTQLPGIATETQEGLVIGRANQIDVFSYNGERLDHIGNLSELKGTVIDATFLTWNDSFDPAKELRPLLAVTVYASADKVTSTDLHRRSWIPGQESILQQPHDIAQREHTTVTSVAIYSLAKRQFVTELLRVTPGNLGKLSGTFQQQPLPIEKLRLRANGNFLTVSSNVSGEIYAFGLRSRASQIQFECLGKFWTTLQPRLQRRDSSHGRASDADISPADIARGIDEHEQAVLSLHGRYLAYCPADGPLRPSLDAVLGASVSYSRSSNISTTSAPSKPSPNCIVESPDVETLFGKVARGVAQELLKGSKWLGEKGMQTFQSYWRKDTSTPASSSPSTYTSPVYSPQPPLPQFPPTHAETAYSATRELELVTIIDLKALQLKDMKKSNDATLPQVTFQPPGGCSFLSFAPNGLSILTASRKGDVQYIWDLIQMRYPRSTVLSSETDGTRPTAKVRQIAKYARLSPSSIVDVAWDSPNGSRFALLTSNRTIHIFDLSANALKWPPPRTTRKARTMSNSGDKSTASQQARAESGGILASAMNLAGQTQPMLTTLRGRAPSISGGFSNISQTGIGFASMTGVRGGKAMAAGLSKSLGAASDTVANIRHAGQSKLHSKVDATSGRISWQWREQRSVLLVLDTNGIRNYYVRKTKPRENRQTETVSVFDARKAVGIKIPSLPPIAPEHPDAQAVDADQNIDQEVVGGFWKHTANRPGSRGGMIAPLSYAEIETNAPYQPFHSDHRVTLSIFAEQNQLEESQLPTASVMLQPIVQTNKPVQNEKWVFGGDVPVNRLNIGLTKSDSLEENTVGSVIYRETTKSIVPDADGTEQIVSTTRRRKNKKNAATQGFDQEQPIEEGFFEDDCDVLDFATDRV